jgi:hypothetical protein
MDEDSGGGPGASEDGDHSSAGPTTPSEGSTHGGIGHDSSTPGGSSTGSVSSTGASNTAHSMSTRLRKRKAEPSGLNARPVADQVEARVHK